MFIKSSLRGQKVHKSMNFVHDLATLVTDFVLLFGINCTEIDQSQSSITYMYIINCESLVFTTLIKCSSYRASTLTRNINKCCVLKILLCVSLRVCTDVDVITLHRV